MTRLEEKLFGGTGSWTYPVFGLFFGVMGAYDLRTGTSDALFAWANVAAAVSMMLFFVGARLDARGISWLAVAALAVWLVLAVSSLFN